MPIKLYLQILMLGQIWSAGCSVWTFPVLDDPCFQLQLPSDGNCMGNLKQDQKKTALLSLVNPKVVLSR